ncbi:MAG: hydroxymethylbilane synthase [Gemmataceae bacterium]|nr:hydroxymethylbilane synthase [Gemmataceae bacterium]
MNTLRIGTRGSPLALWQARFVQEQLRLTHAELQTHLVILETLGDQIRDRALSQIGGDGLFTKEIQNALLGNLVDLGVHSLKDLPTAPVAGLTLGAVPARGPVGDAFVSNTVARFDKLPPGARLGTTSLRRRSQAIARRPDLQLVHLRGNIDTRLNKIETDKLDGIILAEAGLLRLGFQNRIREILDPAWMLPAVGQGALGLECRDNDLATLAAIQPLEDSVTRAAVAAERAFLLTLGGGCLIPVGVRTTIQGNQLQIQGLVLSLDGLEKVAGTMVGDIGEGEKTGAELARSFLQQGADKILQQLRPG